ncbi:MAG: 50S ribosomal protein L29 [Saprospiraceae bacterium]|nr:50S ribosomal protein L29 [Saprospiraceae bacterium]MCB9312469.1 50S ribosomal protein L29 [Lewinellaceae bacterium]
MPSKKTIELQEFSDADLLNELKETEVQFQKLTFDHAIKGLDNPMTIRDVRRDIARLQTEVRRRQMAGMSEAEIAQRDRIRNRRKNK